MKQTEINRIFRQTAYIRTGGSPQELSCAEYLKAECGRLGVNAVLEPFSVDMATIHSAVLTVDGKAIPCKGYLCCGSHDVEAPLYYLREFTPVSLGQCQGKIVLMDGYLGYWKYQDLLDNGAVGFITYDGNANYRDRDIDQRELRSYVSNGKLLPGVNINAKDAISLVARQASTARLQIQQTSDTGVSHNVIAELPGQIDEWIVLTAHFDSTSLSQGAYDNMSGCIGLLHMLQYFSGKSHRRGLRFVWCGSEERGLLGSKAYCESHDLEKVVLNINLDMIGCIMGHFIACCTTEDKLVGYIQYAAMEQGFGCKAYQDVYSSDSTPFADKGVPAVSFARSAPSSTATIHNSYDTAAVMSTAQMQKDMDFITFFTERMAQAALCPVARKIPDNMKEKLDEYLCRKRPKKD